MIWRSHGGHSLAVIQEVDRTKKHRSGRGRKKESRETDRSSPMKSRYKVSGGYDLFVS